jgi:hypothetical protein
MAKPERPLHLEVDRETVGILYGIRKETGRTYGAILVSALMLYRAFLRAGKEPEAKRGRESGRGGKVESVGDVVKRTRRSRKRGV